MKDLFATRQELFEENCALKRRIEELEQAESKHKPLEKILHGNEEILRLCIEHSPAAVAIFDREMKYIAASSRYLMDYDLGEQNLVGRHHYDVFPEMPDRWKEIHRRCLAGAVEKADEDPFPRADGRLDWVRWEIRPWKELGGGIGGIILFSEVITSHKRAEEAVQRGEELSESIINSMPGIFYLVDTQGKFLRWNRNFEIVSGYSHKEILERHPSDFFAGDEKKLVQQRIGEAFAHGEANVEARFVSKNGTGRCDNRKLTR